MRRDRSPAPTFPSTAAGPRHELFAAARFPPPRNRETSIVMKNPFASLLSGRAADAPGAQTTKRINLALQGGGAHGAFTWGVLDHGLARGGRAEAQKRLADFWRAVSSTGNLPAVQRAVIERLLSFTPLEGSPVQAWLGGLSRYFSPYDA